MEIMAHQFEQPVRNEVGDGANSRIDEASKVDRIREILFGSQMRDYDERFQRLEEHLAREASEVRADTQKRLDALERFIKGEVDSINSRAAIEHGERCNATDKLGRDLAETARTLDTQINNLNGQTAKSLGELLEHEAAQIRCRYDGSRSFGRNAERNCAPFEERVSGARGIAGPAAMRGPPGDSVEAFEELRRLLLSGEREQLRDLRDRLNNRERRSKDIAGVLPEAVKLSWERGEELVQALRPAVEGSIKQSIEKKPDTFVGALHPIIGPMVRRSIAESLRRLMQSLNQTLEHTFSWRGLKWRFEALRTGKSFAEVVMLRSLVYRVEQLFLIHRRTSLSLLHVALDPAIAKDSDMVAGMLSAIQDFVARFLRHW